MTQFNRWSAVILAAVLAGQTPTSSGQQKPPASANQGEADARTASASLMAMGPMPAAGDLTLKPRRRSLARDQLRERYLTVAAVGDVMMGSWMTHYLDSLGVDYPFRATRPLLASADVCLANLEAPFTTRGEPFEKRFTFRVPPRYAAGLQWAGINVVTLANNHMMDFGIRGVHDTIEVLDSLGIGHTGAGMTKEEALSPAVMAADGKPVAQVLGYSMTFPQEFYATDSTGGTAYPELGAMILALEAAQAEGRFVIATFHWGAELRTTPKDYQIEWAHTAIDHGADLVIGHHPHVLQGLEIYRNRLIAYSLGNFAFASYSDRARDSAILRAVLDPNGLVYARVYPIDVHNVVVEFQPRLHTRPAGERVIAHLNEISLALNDSTAVMDSLGMILGDFAFATQPDTSADSTLVWDDHAGALPSKR